MWRRAGHRPGGGVGEGCGAGRGCRGAGPAGLVVTMFMLSVLGVGAATLWRSDVAPAYSGEVEEIICKVGALFIGGTCPDDDNGTAAPPQLSVPADPADAIAKAKALATAEMSRFNDWDCKPGTPEHPHPEPVIMVHGTGGFPMLLLPGQQAPNGGATMTSFPGLAAELKRQGYCVFALDYGYREALIGGSRWGGYGYDNLAANAEQLAIFVEGVLAATGAAKVDLVGHSQGGMMPRYYIRFLGGASRVDDLVAIAPSNHGTTTPLQRFQSWVWDRYFPAAGEQLPGSAFLRKLNAGREVEPGVDYTVIATRWDTLVTPYTSQFLSGPPGQVTNITVQDYSPFSMVDHVRLPSHWVTIHFVLDALSHPGPADPNAWPP